MIAIPAVVFRNKFRANSPLEQSPGNGSEASERGHRGDVSQNKPRGADHAVG